MSLGVGRVVLRVTWVIALALGWMTSTPAYASPEPTVIMISLDGTRPSDIDRETLPTLVDLAARGVQAEGLVPATPANTFPGHVTLVTGVPPDRHGIVNNFFIDPERGPFKKRDIPSWLEVEPLWSWFEARGIVTASYHWVGSEGQWPSGRAPTHWKRFRASRPPLEKVKTILAWLDLEDPAQRPRFITSWFPGADHVAHREGPGSPAARKSLAKQEAAFAALAAGLAERGLWRTTTLILVSDHGMTAAQKHLDFDRVLEQGGIGARVAGLGGFANVYLDDDLEDLDDHAQRTQTRAETIERIQSLAEAHGVSAIEVGADDPRFQHPRFGDLVLRAPIGTAFHRAGLPSGGYHGYESTAPEMHGLFIAVGGGIPGGGRLGVVRALDVAPSVIERLGLEAPGWMQGVPIDLSSALSSDPTSQPARTPTHAPGATEPPTRQRAPTR